MINESLRYSGGAFAMKRFAKYRGTVDWKGHGIYMSVQICRAFHKDNGRPCALYAAQIDDSVLLVGESLDRIRAEVKAVVQG